MKKLTPRQQEFVDSMMRCRGIDFARIGMRIEMNGRFGIIKGMNGSCNLDVKFDGNKHTSNVHPTYKIKYYGEDGEVIKDFDHNNEDTLCLQEPQNGTL